jgi:hypothetical protein
MGALLSGLQLGPQFMQAPDRVFSNIVRCAAAVYENCFHSGRPWSHQIPSWVIAHKETVLWDSVQLLQSELKDLLRWLSPSYIPAQDDGVHVFTQAESRYLFSPQVGRAAPRRV